MSEPKTAKRIVKHIPYGEFYPRNLAVTLPSISFLEKPPLWETEWWREQAAKSQLSRMREMSNKKNKSRSVRARD